VGGVVGADGGGVAVILAATGIYGLMAYSVATGLVILGAAIGTPG